jgi:hypothetical protein
MPAKSPFVAFWDSEQRAEDVLMEMKIDDDDCRKSGYWNRYRVERGKLEGDAKALDMEAFDERVTLNIEDEERETVQSFVKGVFLIWRGVKKEAVTERTTISNRRIWELSMSDNAFQEVKKGIWVGALKVVEATGGVVVLKDFAKGVADKEKGDADKKGKGKASLVHGRAGWLVGEEVNDEQLEVKPLAEEQDKIRDILDHLPRESTSDDDAEMYLVDWGDGDWRQDKQYQWLDKEAINGGNISPTAMWYWKRVNAIKKAKDLVVLGKDLAENYD